MKHICIDFDIEEENLALISPSLEALISAMTAYSTQYSIHQLDVIPKNIMFPDDAVDPPIAKGYPY